MLAQVRPLPGGWPRLAAWGATSERQGLPTPTRTAWDLDNLGNWSGGDAGQGSVVTSVDSDGDGQYEVTRRLHHEVNGANEIAAVDDNQVNTAYHYDAAGNLVADGTYYYQYDAWNRLVQVNLLYEDGSQYPADLLPDGRLDYEGTHHLGDLVCRYAYDAVGRLMWKHTPTNEGLTALQRKDYP